MVAPWLLDRLNQQTTFIAGLTISIRFRRQPLKSPALTVELRSQNFSRKHSMHRILSQRPRGFLAFVVFWGTFDLLPRIQPARQIDVDSA